MYCIECGTKNPDHAKFCQKCGYHFVYNQETNEPDIIKADLPKKEKSLPVKVSSDAEWICPECYEENKGGHTVCSVCGYCLTQEDNPPIAEVVKEDNGLGDSWICGECGQENDESAEYCSYCQASWEDTYAPGVDSTRGVGCYLHPERQAVAQCPNCGAFMCRECYNRYEGHMCKNCTYENNQAYISRVRNSLIWAAVLFVLGWIIGGAVVGSGGFLIGLWAAGLPGGFVFTNFDFFATMDMGCLGTVFYWIFRLLVASVAGWIVTIVNIVRLVHAVSVQQELEKMDRRD